MKVTKANPERNGTFSFLHQLGFALSSSSSSSSMILNVNFSLFPHVSFCSVSCTVLVFIVIRDYGQVLSNSAAQHESPERTGQEQEDVMPPDGAAALASHPQNQKQMSYNPAKCFYSFSVSAPVSHLIFLPHFAVLISW